MLISCKKQEENSLLKHQTEEPIHKIKDGDLEILEIDDCEYLLYKEHMLANNGLGYMPHTGNCKSPVQKLESDSSLLGLINKVIK